MPPQTGRTIEGESVIVPLQHEQRMKKLETSEPSGEIATPLQTDSPCQPTALQGSPRDSYD